MSGTLGGAAAPSFSWNDATPACTLPHPQIAPKAFQFFKEYVGIIPANSTQGQRLEQPIQKFDFVAVPGKTGAMEVRCKGFAALHGDLHGAPMCCALYIASERSGPWFNCG